MNTCGEHVRIIYVCHMYKDKYIDIRIYIYIYTHIHVKTPFGFVHILIHVLMLKLARASQPEN